MAAVLSLRERLAEGMTLYGTWVNSDAPEIAETLGLVGFDCVVLDMEHGEFGTEALPDLLRATRAGGCHGLVRTTAVDPPQIMRALDAGAEGVIVPNVADPAEARQIAAAAHYPPAGNRGAAPNGRASGYGVTPFATYRERIERDVVVVAQIEGPGGMANLPAILDVEGIDLVFVGPFDLSQHLGVPGEVHDPAVISALEGIVGTAARLGIATGTWAPTPDLAAVWARAGVRLVTVSSATAMFTEAAGRVLRELRSAAAATDGRG
ncbi:MAG: hypothetical protein H0V19_06030 [Euzebyales bacterium]|nr:hypothetical protein [Euzebyales bacterium]